MYIKLDVYNFISYMNSEILNSKDVYIDNIRTLSENKKIVCIELSKRVEIFSVLFRSMCK
jgi:hypothetical protein